MRSGDEAAAAAAQSGEVGGQPDPGGGSIDGLGAEWGISTEAAHQWGMRRKA
jgi:hypothetical protein